MSIHSSQTIDTEKLGRITIEASLSARRNLQIFITRSQPLVNYELNPEDDYTSESMTMQEAIAFLALNLSAQELSTALVGLITHADPFNREGDINCPENYSYSVSYSEADQVYVAECLELGVNAHGDTADLAVKEAVIASNEYYQLVIT